MLQILARIWALIKILSTIFPLGEEGALASANPKELHFIFLCDMGQRCSTSYNSKSI